MIGLHALVVDDEAVARDGLAMLLAREPQIARVTTCATRDEAIACIDHDRPDVAFLDVQLSPGTGFEIVERISSSRTQIVFVTAFDRYALDAFAAAAVDYVLKPVDPARLRIAVARTAERSRLLEALTEPRSILLSSGSQSLVFSFQDIAWIEGADDYARVYAGGRSVLVDETLQRIEERLPTPPFARVHRSAIVNVDHIARVRRVTRHRVEIVLRGGTRVPLSAARRKPLEALLSARLDR